MSEGNFFGWGSGEGEHACGFLFNFSKMTEYAIIALKIFSTSSVMLLTGLKIQYHEIEIS